MSRIWPRQRGGHRGHRARAPQQVRGEFVPSIPPFGGGCLYVSSPDLNETDDAVNFITHLSLSTSMAIAAGEWFLGVTCYYMNTANTNGDCEIRVQRNGSTLVTGRYNIADGIGATVDKADSTNCFTYSPILTLAQGVHVFDLQLRLGTPFVAGDEAAMYWAEIEFWRFGP